MPQDRPALLRFGQWLTNLALVAIIGLSRLLPYRWRIPAIGWFTSRIIAPLAGFDKRIRNNLARTHPDMPEAERLMELAHDWEIATTDDEREAVWREMLDIHASELYAIGILNGAPQPIVVSNRLRNVPQQAMWAWEPGAHFGVHRPDEFFFAD